MISWKTYFINQTKHVYKFKHIKIRKISLYYVSTSLIVVLTRVVKLDASIVRTM